MPRTAILYVTDRCNLDCAFCLERNADWRTFCEPTTADVCRQIDNLRARGTDHLTFMGAESFFRKDLAQLLAHARDVGITRLGVVTNGTVLSKPGFLAPLMRAGLAFIEVSIHGHTPELANRIAGAEFAWRRQRAALDEIRVAGIPTIVNVVVCRLNREFVREIAEYVASRLGPALQWVKLKFVTPLGAALANDEVALRYDEVDPRPAAEAVLRLSGEPRFYNFPLCRLGDFAHFAHEPEILLTDEQFFDFDHHGEPGYFDDGAQFGRRERPRTPCGDCSLRPLCPGIDRVYLETYGATEFHARHEDPTVLARRVVREGHRDVNVANRVASLCAAADASHAVAKTVCVVDLSDRALTLLRPDVAEPLTLWIEPNDAARPAYARTRDLMLSYLPWRDRDPYADPRVCDVLAQLRTEIERATVERMTAGNLLDRLRRSPPSGWQSSAPPDRGTSVGRPDPRIETRGRCGSSMS